MAPEPARYAPPTAMKPGLSIAAVSLLLSVFAAAGASGEEVWVRGAPLNLRSGAGLDQPVLGSVPPASASRSSPPPASGRA